MARRRQERHPAPVYKPAFTIYYPEDADSGRYDGTFEAGMVVCVESYIGAEGGYEGIKLEQPVLITETGPRLLCDYPLEDDWG